MGRRRERLKVWGEEGGAKYGEEEEGGAKYFSMAPIL